MSPDKLERVLCGGGPENLSPDELAIIVADLLKRVQGLEKFKKDMEAEFSIGGAFYDND